MAEELKRMPLGAVLCDMSIMSLQKAECLSEKPDFGTYK